MLVLSEGLAPVCEPDRAEEILGEMVERGTDPSEVGLEIDPAKAEAAYQQAEEEFLSRVTRVLEEVQRTNDAFVDRRINSLRAYYERNIRRRNESYGRAQREGKQERYLRMLRGTIERLESELQTKENQVEEQRRIGNDWAPVCSGILEIV